MLRVAQKVQRVEKNTRCIFVQRVALFAQRVAIIRYAL